MLHASVCEHTSVFIHSSADGFLGCIQIFAVMNNVAFNILVPVSQSTGEAIWRSITPTVIGDQQQPPHCVLRRNIDLQTLSQTYWIRISRGGASRLHGSPGNPAAH